MQISYTIEQFSELTGLGRTKIYAELKSGRLIAKKCGNRTLIPASNANEWVSSLDSYVPHSRP